MNRLTLLAAPVLFSLLVGCEEVERHDPPPPPTPPPASTPPASPVASPAAAPGAPPQSSWINDRLPPTPSPSPGAPAGSWIQNRVNQSSGSLDHTNHTLKGPSGLGSSGLNKK